MGYCVIRFEKAKGKEALKHMYNHHFRMNETINADKYKESLNETKISPGPGDYITAFYKRFGELEYYKDHSLRKNAVWAYDIVMHYSPSAAGSFDEEKWKEANVEWLKQKFGEKNILSVVYHYDEAGKTKGGAIHGHAVVIPVDDKGKINASYYTDGSIAMFKIQSEYADAMKDFKLDRGLQASKATHTTVQQFYTTLNNAVYGVPMPEQDANENSDHFVERIKGAWREERAAHVRELRDKDREIIELKTQILSQKDENKLIKALQSTIDDYKTKEHELEHEFGSLKKAKELAHSMKLLNDGINSYPDENVSNTTYENAAMLIHWAKEKEKKKARESNLSQEISTK